MWLRHEVEVSAENLDSIPRWAYPHVLLNETDALSRAYNLSLFQSEVLIAQSLPATINSARWFSTVQATDAKSTASGHYSRGQQ